MFDVYRSSLYKKNKFNKSLQNSIDGLLITNSLFEVSDCILNIYSNDPEMREYSKRKEALSYRSFYKWNYFVRSKCVSLQFFDIPPFEYFFDRQ